MAEQARAATGRRAFLAPSPADLILRDIEQRAEHPEAKSTVGVVLHLTGTVPDPADLRTHVAARLPDLPCLVHILRGDGPDARWVFAAPDLAHHISAHRVDDGPDALGAAVRELVQEPWTPSAPAWRLILLHGHVPSGFALLYLTHHSVQDGGNILAVLEALFGPTGHPEQTMVVRGLDSMPRPRLPQVLRSTRPLLRHVRKHHVWSSPAQPLSSRRHLLWSHAPAVWLRAVARAGDAGTNDVYITALAHAITEWANTSWPRAARAPIPLMVPVNLRTSDEVAAPGNRLFLARIDLPGGPMPLGRRLAHTRVLTAPLKSAEHRAVLRTLLTRLPVRPFQRLVTLLIAPGRLTLGVSYVVVRGRLHYGDAVVERMDPIICCPPGAPMAVAVFVYGDEASACFRIDTALPDADTLPARWRQALEDMALSTRPASE